MGLPLTLTVAALVVLLILLGFTVLRRHGRATPAPTSAPAVSRSPATTPTPASSPSATVALNGTPVSAYGAKGDGVSDDTAAVRRALAASAKGRAVAFPAGTYKVSHIVMPRGVTLAGAGADRSWIKGRLEIAGGSHISGVKLGVKGQAVGFVNGAADTLCEDVSFTGGGPMTGDGCVVSFPNSRAAARLTFVRCTIAANPYDGNGVSMSDAGWSGGTYHDILWRECRFLGSPRMDFECTQRFTGHQTTTGYYHIDLVGCTFEPSGSEAISFDGDVRCGRSQVTGCLIKGAGWNRAYPWGQGIEFNGIAGMHFTGNTVYRCRGAMINHNGALAVPTGNVFAGNVFDGTISHIPEVPTAETQTIYFNDTTGDRFERNTVKTDVGGQLLYLAGSSQNVFSGNDWVDVRPGGSAQACALITAASSRNLFSGERFQSAAPGGTVVVHGGAQHTTIRRCTFVSGGAPAVAALPGLTVVQKGNTYR